MRKTGLAGLLVVVAIIAVPVVAFDYLFGGPDTSSPSYQAGVAAGKLINSRPALLVSTQGNHDQACQQAFQGEQDAGAHFDQKDFVQGCLDALQ
jgi:hypothetical protein